MGITTSFNRQQRRVLAILSAIFIIVNFGAMMEDAPMTVIFQDIICKKYYKDAAKAGNMTITPAVPLVAVLPFDCKIEPVQTELAFIIGWKNTIEMIAGIFVAMPYGILADRIGRKPVLALGWIGLLLEMLIIRIICWFPEIFALKLIWLAPSALLIGGGQFAIGSIALTMIADSFAAEDRTNIFYQLGACNYITQILAPPVAAVLLETFGPWVPYLVAMGFMLATLFLTLALPETIQKEQTITSSTVAPVSVFPKKSRMNLIMHKAKHLRNSLTDSTSFIYSSRPIILLLFALLCIEFGQMANQQILIVYASKRLSWTLARASLLTSVKGTIALFLTMIALPVVTQYFTHKRHLPINKFNLMATRTSISFLAVGAASMSLSGYAIPMFAAVVVATLGSTAHSHMRSIITVFTEPSRVGTLYTAMATVQSIGACAAGPSTAALWGFGMRHGGWWMGVPFMVVSGLLFTALVAVCAVRLEAGGDIESNNTDSVAAEEELGRAVLETTPLLVHV